MSEENRPEEESTKGQAEASAENKGTQEAVDSNQEEAALAIEKDPSNQPLPPPQEEAEASSQEEAKVSSQGETEAPSQEEAKVSSQGETEAPSQEEAEASSQEEAEAPSQEEAEASSQEEAEAPSQEEAKVSSQEEAEDSSQEEAKVPSQEEAEAPSDQVVSLEGMYGFKLGMGTVYNAKGVQIPVTVLRVKPWTVTQLKTPQRDQYSAVQISLLEKAEKRVTKPELGHLKKAGVHKEGARFTGEILQNPTDGLTDLTKKGARFTREIRQELPEGVRVGQEVNVTSFEVGQKLKLTARSKGRGFSGVMKRWNFGGGPAAHGSTFHRQPGSIGNCTFPGRVMRGRKMPGHFGNEKVTVKNVEIVDVQVDEGLILVKGPVPGARNGLVKMQKQG